MSILLSVRLVTRLTINVKDKGKHYGEHITQRLDLNVKVERRHLQNVRKALGQQATQWNAQRGTNRRQNQVSPC